MSDIKTYRDFVKSVRSGTEYWKSYTILQFTLALGRVMRAEKLSGKKLAQNLGVSPAFVSKVLSGGENLTVETMVKFAEALDSSVHVHVAKKGVAVQWVEMPAAQSEMAYPRARPNTHNKKAATGHVFVEFERGSWLSTFGQSPVRSTSLTPPARS
jgi:plasmid maintenance system antidote protein VapI